MGGADEEHLLVSQLEWLAGAVTGRDPQVVLNEVDDAPTERRILARIRRLAPLGRHASRMRSRRSAADATGAGADSATWMPARRRS